MDKETADKVRGLVRRAVLKNVKDDGQTQTASVEVADGVWRDDVEILQPYGFASHVPEDGALAIVLAVGGDEGDLIVLPVANPSKRFGKLSEGEVGLYNQFGDRIVIGAGGKIEIAAGASVEITVNGVSFTLSAAGHAHQGGQVTHDGHDMGKTHRHKDSQPGSGTTGVPQ
jgi:phage baseplate assembly protein V